MWIVCGFYTPDYAHWADRLANNLDDLGAPHDLERVDKHPGGWERNTMLKPQAVMRALQRHPDKTILFLDVDCVVTGSLDDLTQEIAILGDIGFYATSKLDSRGRPKFRPRSGTFVFRQTDEAYEYVQTWIALGEGAPPYAVDQDTMTVALTCVPGLAITMLGVEACALPADKCSDPIILHESSAAKGTRKAGKFRRFLSSWRAA